MRIGCHCISYVHTKGFRACRYGKPLRARVLTILQMKLDGESTDSIADHFGVTASRINKYIEEAKSFFQCNDIRTVCFKASIKGWIS